MDEYSLLTKRTFGLRELSLLSGAGRDDLQKI